MWPEEHILCPWQISKPIQSIKNQFPSKPFIKRLLQKMVIARTAKQTQGISCNLYSFYKSINKAYALPWKKKKSNEWITKSHSFNPPGAYLYSWRWLQFAVMIYFFRAKTPICQASNFIPTQLYFSNSKQMLTFFPLVGTI